MFDYFSKTYRSLKTEEVPVEKALEDCRSQDRFDHFVRLLSLCFKHFHRQRLSLGFDFFLLSVLLIVIPKAVRFSKPGLYLDLQILTFYSLFHLNFLNFSDNLAMYNFKVRLISETCSILPLINFFRYSFLF